MKIILREIKPNDGKYIVKWRNTPKVNKHCFDKKNISENSHNDFYIENVITGKYIQYIVEKVDEEVGVCSYPIGTMYLKDIDRIGHKCELGMFMSDDEEWNDESKFLALKKLLDKAFKDFGFLSVYSYVYVNCEDEIALLKKSGFEYAEYLDNEISSKSEEKIVKMIIEKNK